MAVLRAIALSSFLYASLPVHGLQLRQSSDEVGSPHDSMPEPLPDALAAEVVANVRSFVKASPRKRTVLLTLGDSTMGGLETRIFQALHTVGGDFGLWTWGQCPGWGEGCKSFSEAPAFNDKLTKYQDVFDQIKGAMSILETNGCNFGGHAFLARSYLGGEFIHYSWGFGAESFGACWAPCLTDAIKSLQPDAVVVNQGLHLLHAYPFRSCKASGPVSFYDCGKHEDMVTNIMSQMQTVTPISIWKTSNWVCDEKYYGFWRDAIDDWHNDTKKDALEESCEQECAGYSKDRLCGDEVIDARSTKIQRDQALRAVSTVRSKASGKVGVIDAFKVSEGRCDATEDGRHYRALDPEVLRLMSVELASLSK